MKNYGQMYCFIFIIQECSNEQTRSTKLTKAVGSGEDCHTGSMKEGPAGIKKDSKSSERNLISKGDTWFELNALITNMAS